MSRLVALPYLTAESRHVAAGAWLGVDTQPLMAVPDWDYGTELHTTRAIELDVPAIRNDCHLADDARLALTVIWQSTKTGMRGAISVLALPRAAERWSGELKVRLEGAELGGEMRLITRLLLADPGSASDALAPTRVGSILWQDRHAILLEGGAARFPMEVIDFRAARLPAAEAAWYLEWPRDELEQPVLGALRLYLNDGHPTIRSLINGELVDDQAAMVVSVMRFDAARSLVTGALDDDEFIDEAHQYDEGSIGATLRRMAAAYWPDQTLGSLRNHLRSRPDSFNTELQERMRLLFPID